MGSFVWIISSESALSACHYLRSLVTVGTFGKSPNGLRSCHPIANNEKWKYGSRRQGCHASCDFKRNEGSTSHWSAPMAVHAIGNLSRRWNRGHLPECYVDHDSFLFWVLEHNSEIQRRIVGYLSSVSIRGKRERFTSARMKKEIILFPWDN